MIYADMIAKELESSGITHVFCYAGGTISFLIDAIKKNTNIKIITTRHEQGASFMASAFSKSGNGLGCCIATSGPGALNLITGIADAYYDYTSILCIVGQCGSEQSSKPVDINIRQNGFQYCDIMSITESISCDSVEVYSSGTSIKNLIRKCKKNRAPLVISIPIDIQRRIVL